MDKFKFFILEFNSDVSLEDRIFKFTWNRIFLNLFRGEYFEENSKKLRFKIDGTF